ALEALADRGQDRHLPVGPLDAPDALGRQRQVLHVVSLRRRHAVLSVVYAARRRSCLRCSHSSALSLPASQVWTASRSPGSRRSLAAKATSESSTPYRARSSRSDRSWFSSRMPYTR